MIETITFVGIYCGEIESFQGFLRRRETDFATIRSVFLTGSALVSELPRKKTLPNCWIRSPVVWRYGLVSRKWPKNAKPPGPPKKYEAREAVGSHRRPFEETALWMDEIHFAPL